MRDRCFLPPFTILASEADAVALAQAELGEARLRERVGVGGSLLLLGGARRAHVVMPSHRSEEPGLQAAHAGEPAVVVVGLALEVLAHLGVRKDQEAFVAEAL